MPKWKPKGGDEPKPQKKTCETCLGTGKLWVEHPSGDPAKSKSTTCPWCNGSGQR